MRDLASLSICFLAGTLGQGGAERQLYYILSALQRSGACPRLLCLTQGEFWEGKLRDLGIRVTWVGEHASKLGRVRRILAELRKERPEIFQSQHFYTNLYVAAAARALGLREVGAMRNDGISEVRANGAVLGGLSLRLPRLLAANSQAAIRNAVALGVPASRLRFLPNVVDTEQFRPPAHRAEGPVRLLTVGRLVEQKRVDRFLLLLSRLRAAGTGARGVIVGDGPLRAELERQAADLRLGPHEVEFRGAVREMAPVYGEADLLLLTSDHEGTPNVVLEAMACGLPVVATRVGGVPDIVRHGETGYLVQPGEEVAALEILQGLIADAALRRTLGGQARDYVLERHSVQRLPHFLEELYREMPS
jgi:glycosyltransferase involved in cell wall biosynthesis